MEYDSFDYDALRRMTVLIRGENNLVHMVVSYLKLRDIDFLERPSHHNFLRVISPRSHMSVDGA